jgi:hypothetical protein
MAVLFIFRCLTGFVSHKHGNHRPTFASCMNPQASSVLVPSTLAFATIHVLTTLTYTLKTEAAGSSKRWCPSTRYHNSQKKSIEEVYSSLQGLLSPN